MQFVLIQILNYTSSNTFRLHYTKVTVRQCQKNWIKRVCRNIPITNNDCWKFGEIYIFVLNQWYCKVPNMENFCWPRRAMPFYNWKEFLLLLYLYNNNNMCISITDRRLKLSFNEEVLNYYSYYDVLLYIYIYCTHSVAVFTVF